jgi:hypothetical protein
MTSASRTDRRLHLIALARERTILSDLFDEARFSAGLILQGDSRDAPMVSSILRYFRHVTLNAVREAPRETRATQSSSSRIYRRIRFRSRARVF